MMTEVYLTPLQYTVHILYILILSFNLILYKTIHCMVYVVESIVLICDSMVYCGIFDYSLGFASCYFSFSASTTSTINPKYHSKPQARKLICKVCAQYTAMVLNILQSSSDSESRITREIARGEAECYFLFC